MSSQTTAQHVPNRETADARVAGARFQLESLQQVLKTDDQSLAKAESCVSGAIDQLLQAISASLGGFNSMLPDPVPAQRVNRKNLRDQFYAVNAESHVLQRVDHAARAGEGWLWSLEQKHDGAAFGHLLLKTQPGETSTLALVRDPFDHSSGTEGSSPVEYLNTAVDQVLQLLSEIGEKAAADVVTYREAQRRQARRLI